MTIKLSSIAAMAENRVIGQDNKLLWHIPEDFKHFKSTTMGCPLIMGRKTFESLPGLLEERPHIIISRTSTQFSEEQESTSISPELYYVKSIEKGIEIGKAVAEESSVDEVFIIGGGEIYKQTMPIIDRLYLTLVHREYDGDTFFPEFNWNEWNITREELHEAEPDNDRPAFTFFTLERK